MTLNMAERILIILLSFNFKLECNKIFLPVSYVEDRVGKLKKNKETKKTQTVIQGISKEKIEAKSFKSLQGFTGAGRNNVVTSNSFAYLHDVN